MTKPPLSPSNNLKEQLIALVHKTRRDAKASTIKLGVVDGDAETIATQILTLILDSLLDKPEMQEDKLIETIISPIELKELELKANQVLRIRNQVRTQIKAVIEEMKS